MEVNGRLGDSCSRHSESLLSTSFVSTNLSKIKDEIPRNVTKDKIEIKIMCILCFMLTNFIC